MGPVQGSLRSRRRRGGLRRTALDFAQRCDPLVYLSNTWKEALSLVGSGDLAPFKVRQALEDALRRGVYVPGEEALRMRLADAAGLEERLMAVLLDELETGLDPRVDPVGDEPTVDPDAAVNEHLAASWPELTLEAAATEEATTEGQEAAEEASADRWRSPLEIVTEGAEEAPQEAAGEEDAAPAAVAGRIEDQDFSSFSKPKLCNFAREHFGVSLRLSALKDELIARVQELVDEANEKSV